MYRPSVTKENSPNENTQLDHGRNFADSRHHVSSHVTVLVAKRKHVLRMRSHSLPSN